MKRGMDVSEFQGKVQWDKVVTDFVIIRAGYGQKTLDAQFVRNIQECNRLNIPCGVYWFSYALTPEDAAQEAKACLNAVQPYNLEYPVCFDFEYDSVRYAQENGVTVTARLATDMVKAFCSTVEEAGYYAMYYANEDYLRNMFYTDELSRYDLWYALYNRGSEPGREGVGIWQYTGQGYLAGVDGTFDLDYAYKDYAQIIRDAGLNQPKKTEENPVKEFQELVLPLLPQDGADGIWGPETSAAAAQSEVEKGSSGPLVKLVQERLLAKGYSLPVYGADGIFGDETDKAVRQYQKDHGLKEDGIVGIATYQSLLDA